jgi:hypothetical protein
MFALATVNAAEFKLSVAGLDENRRPTLLLSGLEAGQYGLEASTNMTGWFSLFSGIGTDGQLRYQHAEAVNFSRLFYRGVKLPDATVSKVVPQVDSNAVAVAVITPEAGGTLTLTDRGGTKFRFTVAPSNVIESVAVTMQLVTNFTAFPADNAMRSAVLFKPDGFQFQGAGLLEIQYPTNIPSLKISSFAFGGDGSGFFLTPDVISTNVVRIPVTHFSGVGTGLWDPTARTTAVTTHIENTRDRMSQDMAGILGRERDRRLLGAEPQTNLGAEMQLRLKDYFDNYLKPFFVEARKDCALAQFLMREILGTDRQGQLLGITNGPASSFLGSGETEIWICNCQKEALKACEDGKISDGRLIRTVLGIERQAQLLGGSGALEKCGLGSLGDLMEKAMDRKLPCAREWFGLVSYSDGGSRSGDCSSSSEVECHATTTVALTFESDVEDAVMQDESFLPFFSKQTWRLKLIPVATGSFSSESVSTQKLPCGTLTTTSSTSAANSGDMELEAEFVFEDGQLTEFGIRMMTGKSLELKTEQSITDSFTGCEGTGGSPKTPGFSNTQQFNHPTFLDPEPALMEDVVFTKRTQTALQGTVQGTRSGLDGIKMPYSWKFSIRRNGP